MFRNFTALTAGLIFGLGLVISQMVNPAKVIGFLDIAGEWDLSLAFVMGGAVIVTSLGYAVVLKRKSPFAATKFNVPKNRALDKPLAIGAILFGVGWGLVGLCPGPALAALLIGGKPAIIFLVAMASGMVLFEAFTRLIQKSA